MKWKTFFITIGTLFVLTVLFGIPASAVPLVIQYQGRLTDLDGEAITDPSVSMAFRIYAMEAGDLHCGRKLRPWTWIRVSTTLVWEPERRPSGCSRPPPGAGAFPQSGGQAGFRLAHGRALGLVALAPYRR